MCVFYDALGSFETTPGTTASAVSAIVGKGRPCLQGTSGHTGKGRPRAPATLQALAPGPAPDLKAETPGPHLDDPAAEASHVRQLLQRLCVGVVVLRELRLHNLRGARGP